MVTRVGTQDKSSRPVTSGTYPPLALRTNVDRKPVNCMEEGR